MIVVTGGSKGIGRAIIEKFAAQGHDAATCARNETELRAMKREVEAQYGTRVFHLVADLAERAEVERFAAYVRSLDRPLDGLVNNTGLFIPGQTHSEEDGVLDLMLNTNLLSAYHLTRALLPPMLERQKGHIFNICSTASIVAYPNGGSYCISKFALYGFTKVLREELKNKQLRVTAVLPGATYTASWDGVDLPPERFMPPADVAEAVWAAFALTGQTVLEEILVRPQLGDIM
jgi:short-subunit dehydrogenase